MSREIEFRAFDIYFKKLVKVNEIDFSLKNARVLSFDNITPGAVYKTSLDTLKLMQYTELKDKNGVEIYEGDIVIFRDKEKFVVEYNNERAEYRAFYYKIEDRDIYTERLISDRCEVIGNIYENEELLNV